MKLYWHNREDEDTVVDLLLIFSGWGCDHNLLNDTNYDKFDILLVYDYRSVDISSLKHQIKSYQNIYVIAWSFGVYIAESCLADINNIVQSIAVNGTSYPVDDERGIPCAIVKNTIEGLNENNLKKFFMRMTGGREQYNQFLIYKPERSLEKQKQELENIYSAAINDTHHSDFKWSMAIISTNDKIFPPENMLRAWTDKVPITVVDKNHFIPFNYLIEEYLLK